MNKYRYLFFNLFFVFALTTLAQAKNKAIERIVIDAGHGGTDPGNLGTGKYKTTEKHITLDVALLVGEYITKNIKDVEVLYTRKKDTYPTLQDRAKFANDNKADLFISIHCDAFTKSKVQGSTSLVLGNNHHEKSRIAIQENGLLVAQEGTDVIKTTSKENRDNKYGSLLYKDLYLQQSVSFAAKIQKEFKTRVNRIDRGVKHQSLYVIRSVSMPSVLVELGFLTNPTEEKFLNSKKGKEYMASAIYRAFKDYKKEQDQILATQSKQEDKVSDEDPLVGTYYCVQLISSNRKLKKFNGLKPVEAYKEKDTFKYLYGQAFTIEKARELQQEARKKGYKDAFIVGMIKGKKVSASQVKL
ncbi:MAG: N-acetylmuramoyl-L-alanine amidase family protein [Flavobacteriales bacterium]